MAQQTKGLVERLRLGEKVIVAEGYLFEFERRGYLKAGAFVPEVVIEHPDLVRVLHEEFVHAGSDVVQAFTYYGHREKLRLIGREDDLEKLNRDALRLARQVADATGTLMAGNISNTTIYRPDNEQVKETIRQMCKEQIEWAVEEGADFIVAETFFAAEEAKIALECILQYGKGLPAVVTLAASGTGVTTEGIPLEDVCRELEEVGAACVGLNCFRGPDSIVPLMRKVKKACKGPVACLPVPYRTTLDKTTMFNLQDPVTGDSPFPCDLDAWLCSRTSIVNFTKELLSLGVEYMGVCCGCRAHMIRAMAETVGRTPPASRYSPDMSQHVSLLKDEMHVFDSDGFDKIGYTK